MGWRGSHGHAALLTATCHLNASEPFASQVAVKTLLFHTDLHAAAAALEKAQQQQQQAAEKGAGAEGHEGKGPDVEAAAVPGAASVTQGGEGGAQPQAGAGAEAAAGQGQAQGQQGKEQLGGGKGPDAKSPHHRAITEAAVAMSCVHPNVVSAKRI